MTYEATITIDVPEVKCDVLALMQAELIARARAQFTDAVVVEVSFFEDGELVAVS